MYKKCLLLISFVLVLEVRSDCDGYLECFNDFFNNFFNQNDSKVEYVNTTSQNLPENFVEVKDLQISDINKVLSDISTFIQQDITDHLNTQSDSSLFTNVNPNTKVYVKTFHYNSPGNILPNFENININKYLPLQDDKESEKDTSMYLPTPQTTTKSDEAKIIENQQDVSENEIPSDDIVSYYDSAEDNSTDYPILDYVEMYKDTTNEENVYEATEVSAGNIKDDIQESLVEYVDRMENIIWDSNNTDPSGSVSVVFPWISTIFLKNDSKSNQFEYFCDGALLSAQLLITAARCVTKENTTVETDSLLVILGKRSLLSMAEKEQMVKIKQIITHENFTNENGQVKNDLALLVLEKPVSFNEIIQPASVGNETETADKSATTAWSVQGALEPVSLEDKPIEACTKENMGENVFCTAYGNDVALCPSYGGIFAGQHNGSWSLYGIRSGDPSDRGLCFNKNIMFTDLRMYLDWIVEYE